MSEPDRVSLHTSADDPRRLWEEFCEALKEAGAVLDRAGMPGDERTLAEAYRFLVRMVRVGFENAHELADRERPRLSPMVGGSVQYEGVTSDARYLHAFVDGTATHRIRGWRGDAPLIEFGVYTGKMGIDAESRFVASITEQTLEVAKDGTVEVILSPDEHPGNWIRTGPEVRYAMVRQYAADWAAVREGWFTIEREGGPAGARAIDLATIRKGLEGTVAFARVNPGIWAGISDYWRDFAKNRFVAELSADDRTDIAAPAGHHFSCGYFELGPGRALDVRFRPEGAAFWSLGLASYWYETIGYGRRDSHHNSGTAAPEPDGSIRVVISEERPPASAGVRNWLDPCGHREGTMVFRWSRSPRPVPDIACKDVALERL